MKIDGFFHALLFAIFAAFGAIPWLVVAAPFAGGRRAVLLYLVLIAAAYATSLAPGGSRRLRALVFVTGAGLAVVFISPSLVVAALMLGIVLAVARSAVLHRARPVRALVTETLLVGSGLVFAGSVAGPSVASIALAIWAFFLVQAVFFLIGGISLRTERDGQRDPFEEACARAEALLDEARA